MKTLYLVGTNHIDLKGPERLRKFLGFVRPQNICLEASEKLVTYKLERRAKIKELLKDDVSLPDLSMETLRISGYEIWASYEYKKEENSPVRIHPIHNHDLILRGQDFYKGIYGGINDCEELGKIKDVIKFQEKMDMIYSGSGESYSEIDKLVAFAKECDNILEQGLRDVLQNIDGTTVFFCGCNHFFANYGNNLYDRLKDLSPHRLKLPELDQF